MIYRYTQIALLIAAAAILSSLESLVQMPVPFVRLGLANVVTLLALKWWNLKTAVFIVLIRVLISSLIVGKFMQPAFFMALGGALTAAMVMAVLLRFGKSVFTDVGVSIGGALSHNTAQLVIAYFLFIHQIRLFSFFPLIMFTSLFSGLCIGIIAVWLDRSHLASHISRYPSAKI